MDGYANAKSCRTNKNYGTKYIFLADDLLVHRMKNDSTYFGTSKDKPCTKRQIVAFENGLLLLLD